MGRALFPLVIFTICALGIAAAAAQTGRDGEVSGIARVVDGDTLEIRGTRIRLAGIDAPESHQSCRDEKAVAYACGNSSTQALANLIAGQTVSCRSEGLDRFRRTLAVCGTSRVADLGFELIRQGWATVYDGAPARPSYLRAEQSAERGKLGLWRGSFERPSAWRRHSAARGHHHA